MRIRSVLAGLSMALSFPVVDRMQQAAALRRLSARRVLIGRPAAVVAGWSDDAADL